jgi:hypothetical protein
MLFRAALVAVSTLVLLGVSCGGSQANTAASMIEPDASDWVIGPIIKGRNYSVRMPLHPMPMRNGAFYIDLPRHPASVHYVTFPHGSLAGKSRIVMRYRIVADPGVQFHASTDPGSPGIITPFFQRAGDNWTARGPYEAFRWYGTFATKPLATGEHVIVAPLNAKWTAVQTSNAYTNSAGFRDAVANADQVGFVLGGGTGYGHGAYATGRARLIVTRFSVE